MKKPLVTLLLLYTELAFAQMQTQLVARASYQCYDVFTGYIKQDSSHYYYTGTRPGKTNIFNYTELIKCDSALHYTNSNNYWREDGKTKLFFDVNDNTTYWLDLTRSTFKFDSTGRYTYTYTLNKDTATKKYEKYSNFTWQTQYNIANTYDISGRLIESLTDNFTSPYYDQRVTYTYDTAGNILLAYHEIGFSTTGPWQSSYRKSYTYTGNNLTEVVSESYNGTIWSYNDREARYYNGKNLVDSILKQQWDAINNKWKNLSKELISYDTAGRILYSDYYQLPKPTTNGVDTGLRKIYIYDTHNNITEQILVSYAAANVFSDTLNRSVYEYDNYNNLTVWRQQAFSSSSTWISIGYLGLYYYAAAWPASINDNIKTPTDIKIYPVPAVDLFNVHVTWKSAQPFTVVICDMQGRIVRQWLEPECTQYTSSVSVAGLKPGNYLLQLTGNKEKATKQFIIQ